MNTHSQILFNQTMMNYAMMNNNMWTAIALSRCHNNPHRTPSKGGMYVCGGMLLLLIIACIATFIMIRKA